MKTRWRVLLEGELDAILRKHCQQARHAVVMRQQLAHVTRPEELFCLRNGPANGCAPLGREGNATLESVKMDFGPQPPFRSAAKAPGKKRKMLHVTQPGQSKWMRDHQIKTLSWPAQSPDPNPIENLWHVIKRKLDGHKPSKKAELLEFLCQEWRKVTQQQCERLVESMPRRIAVTGSPVMSRAHLSPAGGSGFCWDRCWSGHWGELENTEGTHNSYLFTDSNRLI
ncbi:hypothetical protein P4O66_000786 [Electrophorus voltai]|uniref:Tc1-like transposase DDE domain-containing protein n=1 Tax=Electrophorus voltai TaxID=2609070 RepID=A0AAD8ZDW7_9TELE|nr:hypothetical protein P4O66_000786 [Electrophorus voltai]